MSAGKEVSLDPQPQKLAIIAGSGTLPRDLYHRCTGLGIECYVVGFKGSTNYITPDFWGNVGKSSKIIAYLKENNIKDLVLIGGINKPNIRSLRLDWTTLKFFFKTWLVSFGDSNVLSSARKSLENLNFNLHGVHKFLPELLMPEGLLNNVDIDKAWQNDISFGVQEARALGQKDIGQAVLVKDGQVIAKEDKHGTNAMIEIYGQEGAILVKMCKPQQDYDLDLPTIGSKTVHACAEKGIVGIVGHAGYMLMAEQQEVADLAAQYRIFLLGYSEHA